jgi:hypothetical protein
MIKITNIVALPLARQGLVTTSVRTPYRRYSFASTTIRPCIEREPFSTDRPLRDYPLSLILVQQLRPHQLCAFVKYLEIARQRIAAESNFDWPQ